jgi:REP element-mobilizing transposase RayT
MQEIRHQAFSLDDVVGLTGLKVHSDHHYYIALTMWNDTDIPLAYFVSFRAYGTWLHGDKRGSIDRFNNRYRSPYIPPNENWQSHNQRTLKAEPLTLKARQRTSVDKAIRETCEKRKWQLHAINIRTNHVPTVASAGLKKPEIVLNAFKANATRQLRQDGLWPYTWSPWADKGSKRRLWNEQSVAKAIDYVLNGQGDDLPDFDD